MIEAMGLKILHRGPFQWHNLRTKFHEILPRCSEAISGGHTHRRTDRLLI
jgi:hypothetical protein